jgi:hypothetical protein
MKTTLLVALLALSVIANAVLLFQHTGPATASSPAASAAASGPDAAASPASTPAEAERAEAARFAQTWTRLQAGDPKAFIAWLRAAGFAPSVIRAIVVAQVAEQFSARRAALLAQQKETPFWKNPDYASRDPKWLSAMRELNKEQSKAMKDLLGANALSDNPELKVYQHRQFGDLPQEKIEQVQTMLNDYNELRSELFAKTRGVMLPEDRQSIALIEKEQRADLAALLTPQELEDYDLRNSPVANQLRSQLNLFDPTEQEFRALFKLQQATEPQPNATGTIAFGDQYRQRQQDLLAQAATVLTPERYEAYKQAIEPAYQNASRLLTRLDLPTTLAPQLVSTQQEVVKQASALQSDRTLTTEQRNAQLGALLESTTARLSTLLGGTRGLEAYKAQGGGWLQMLQPRKTPTPPRG